LNWPVSHLGGQPQIEVTFEIDVNGILTVSAEEKSTGKVEQVTITSDKGRLSEEEIERMVREAEEMAEQDKEAKERVLARNDLENLIYSVKSQLSDEKLGMKDKLSESEVSDVETAVKEAGDWLDENMQATKEEYEEKKHELESVVHPIFKKYQGEAAGQADSGEMPEHDDL